MVKTLYDIGNILKEDANYSTYFEPWQIPFKKTQSAMVLEIDIVDEKLIFPINNLKVYSRKKVSKYLYREAPGRATNLVPTFYFYIAKGDKLTNKWKTEQETNINKLVNKIKASINNNNHEFIDVEDIDQLRQPLLEKSKTLDAANFYLFTFKINGKYFGEIEEFKELFYKEAYKKYHSKVYGKSKVEGQICALTGEKSTVFGYVDTLGFTVNDPAFMRNGFNQDYAYKMFPISDKAVSILEGAMSFVENNIEQSFYGNIKYSILPQFISKNTSEYGERIIRKFTNAKALDINSQKEDKGLNGFITASEDYIEAINQDTELQQLVNYEILFFARNNSQIGLLLYISDVIPSHLGKIKSAKISLQNFYAPLTNVAAKEDKKAYTFLITLYKIKNYFLSEQGKKKIPHPLFYRLTEAIFCKQQMREEVILKFIVADFRKKFKQRQSNAYGYSSSVKEGFIILQFLTKIGLFNTKKQQIMSKIPEKIKLSSLDFIEQHPSYFDSNYKKGAFLFGCIIRKLLNKQQGNAFLKELNNLNFDKDLINKKFPKVKAKLMQHNKNKEPEWITELEIPAANYFIIGAKDKLSKDEISMAVTLGMVLQRDFDNKNRPKSPSASTSE